MTVAASGERDAPTPWQRHMWLSQRVRPDRIDLNTGAAVHLRGPLDIAALDRAVRAVAERYPLLRSYFPPDDGGLPRRVVADEASGIERTVLQVERPDDPRVRLRIRRLFHHVFDPAGEPPLCAEVIEVGARDHVLAVVAHRLACDEPGICWWIDRVAAAYRGEIDTAETDLDGPDLDFDRLWGSTGDRWGHHPVSGVAPVFPGEDSTTPVSGRSQVVGIPLTGSTAADLAAACARLDVTMPAAVTAAAAIAIARICGVWEFPIAVSLPASGRRAPGTADRVIRYGVDRLTSLRGVITTIDRVTSIDRDVSTGPVSGIVGGARIRAVHHRKIDADFGAEISLQTLTDETGHTAYPLTIDIGPDLRLVHDPSVVSATVAAALAEATATILDALVDDGEVAAVDLPLVRNASRDELLDHSYGRRFPVEPATVLDAIDRRLRDDPLAPAVIDDGRTVTRAEVDHQSRAIAERLHRNGIGTGDVVATLLLPSTDLVASALAILRIGAVFLPVDPRGDASVLRELFDRVRPDAVVTENGTEPAAIVGRATAVVSATPNPLDKAPSEMAIIAPHPGQPAYLVAARDDPTMARMVTISHAALSEYVGWLGRLADLRPDESVLQVAPPGFDVGITEIFGCLTAGVRLVIPRADRSHDMAYLTELIRRHRVGTMHAVPSQLVNLLAEPNVQRWTSLRCIPVGGEPLPARLANRFTATFDATLHNFYGVTEMTLAAGHHEVTAASGHGFVPVGRPKDNARILVLDERLHPVPDGMVGEIYVGGGQLAIGYHRRPGDTAGRFVADPFAPGDRLFRTGDRGRWTDRGLDYCGRVDQPTIRGLSVDRGAVERVVADVLDAPTAVVDVVGRRDLLVAWVVGPKLDPGSTLEDARDRLAALLPDHLVPEVIVPLERIPLTTTGMIDRDRLPIPEAPDGVPGRAPRTPIEERICRLVAEISHRASVFADDSITELGWGPVTAAELGCRLSAEFGVAVTTDNVVRWSTPAAMAAAIDTAVLASSVDAIGPAARPAAPITAPAVPARVPTLVVVGAGPKGIAVAVKASVLREAGLPAPRVVIVERRGIGANWTPAGGWTDGSQRLGTSPEKDLGFPYRSVEFRGLNRHVDQAAQRYSWSSYLIAAGTFGEWVDRGRPAPRHREWARYLQWAAESAEVEVVSDEVTRLSIRDGRWRIGLAGDAAGLVGDAVMVSGPGAATSDWETLGPRVVGPAAFWRAVVERAVPDAAHIAVIGAGETGGAILHELSRQDVASITVIAPRASLFTRGEGYFENRVFTDSVRWESLSIPQRREVIERADRGVLSTRVMDEIRLDGRIAHLEGRVRSARTTADGIRLGIDTAAGPTDRDFDWVIDARGSRDLWMLDLLDAGARDLLERAIGGPAGLDRLQLSVGRDLAVEGLFPQLFTPSLAALRQGPGFPNLSCLGLLADRICAGVTEARHEMTHDRKPLHEARQGWTLV